MKRGEPSGVSISGSTGLQVKEDTETYVVRW